MMQNICPNDIVARLGSDIAEQVENNGASSVCLTLYAEQVSDIVNEDGEECYYAMEASIEPYWVEVEAPDGIWYELRRIYLYSASITFETPEDSIEMDFDWKTLKNSLEIN